MANRKVWLLLLGLLVPAAAQAQIRTEARLDGVQQVLLADSLRLLLSSPDALLRVRHPTGGQSIGKLEAALGDTLLLRRADGVLRTIPGITTADIEQRLAATRFEGFRSRGVAGFVLGGIIGALLPVLQDVGTSCPDTNSTCPITGTDQSLRERAVTGFFVYGAIGAGLGAVTGFISPGEIWKPIRR